MLYYIFNFKILDYINYIFNRLRLILFISNYFKEIYIFDWLDVILFLLNYYLKEFDILIKFALIR